MFWVYSTYGVVHYPRASCSWGTRRVLRRCFFSATERLKILRKPLWPPGAGVKLQYMCMYFYRVRDCKITVYPECPGVYIRAQALEGVLKIIQKRGCVLLRRVLNTAHRAMVPGFQEVTVDVTKWAKRARMLMRFQRMNPKQAMRALRAEGCPDEILDLAIIKAVKDMGGR